MNFIKKYLSEKKNINVILTLQVPKADIDPSEFKDFTIVNCYEMLEKYNYHPPADPRRKKLE